MNIKETIRKGITEKHTGKMEGMQSLSTSCHLNPICKARRENGTSVCPHCYAWAMLERYKNLGEKLAKNTEIFTTVDLKPGDIPTVNSAFFRLEAFGDIMNTLQVKNYFTFARNNRHCHFTLWTKNPKIIANAKADFNLKKPGNLTIIYSSPDLNTSADRYIREKGYKFVDKIFTVYEKDHAEKTNVAINCGSKKCSDCLLCYGKNKTRFINELLK